MPVLKEYNYQSSDGRTDIYARSFVPDGQIKGTVQIAHGVAEYSGRYDEFMYFLAENGYAAVANDHLGHGKSVASEADRGFFAENNGWNIVVSDMKKLHDIIKEEYPDVRSVVFGHSMGSFLTRTYLIDYPDDFDAAVICGTGQQSTLILSMGVRIASAEVKRLGPRGFSERLQALAFGNYNRDFEPARTPSDWLSKNTENVDCYIADPLCGGESSASLFRDMLGGIRYVGDKANVSKMNKDIPLFLIAGDMDPVGEKGKGVNKAFKLYKGAGIKDISMKLYPGLRHEILNEDIKENVMNDILDWINDHIK